MRADLKNFSPSKFKNLKEMETFINAYDLTNLHQEEINILNRTKASSEGETNIKKEIKQPTNKQKTSQLEKNPRWIIVEFYQVFKV